MKLRFLFSALITLVFMIQPASALAQMPPVGAKVFLSQNEVYLGEVFRVYTTGFSADPSYIRFISDTSPAIQAKFTIVGVSYSDIPLSVRIDEVINSSQDHNQFFIELKDFQGNLYLSKVKLLVIGQGKAVKILPGIKFGVKTDCAVSENVSRSIQATWRLFKEDEPSKTLTTGTISREQGYDYYGYYSFDIKAGDTFVIEVEPIKGMAAKPTTSNYRFTIPNPAPDVFYVPGDLVIFEYPSCPGGLVPTPSPTPSSTLLPTPSPLPSRTTIKVNATVLCGVNDKLIRSIVYMKKEYGGAVVTSAEIYGKGTFEYSGPSAISGQRFILQATEFPDEIPYVEPGPYPIFVPYPPPAEMEVSVLFSSPYCPVRGFLPPTPEPNITGDTAFYYTSPTPEPLPIGTTEPQGGLLQPPETPATSPQEMQITQVTLSNYADFSFDPADQGSYTTNILNPETPRKITWTLSTISSGRTIYVREIYSDGTYQEFQYDNLANGQIVYAGNLEINIKLIKRAVKITIGDKEIDISNPDFPLWLHLPGIEGQGQQFRIPVVITYSDGSTLYTALTFNYNPPPPTPAPVARTCTYEETPQGCPYGGIRSCDGIRQEEACVYDDSGQVPPDCREACNPAPPSGGGGSNTCAYTESFSCTGQNGGCGGGSGEMRKTIINTDCSENSVSYCDGACAPSGGGGSGASCPESYPECRGANTFWITPECDSGNIINYKAEDLGDLGQC